MSQIKGLHEMGFLASSQAALRWARASAAVRSRSVDGAAPIDSFDVLSGLLLAHRDGGELAYLLRHVGVSPGAVLAQRISVPLQSSALAEAQRELFAIGYDAYRALLEPPMADVVAIAARKRVRSADGVTLGTLASAFLAVPSEVTEIVVRKCEARGISRDHLIDAFDGALERSSDQGFEQALGALLAVPPAQMELPSYQADEAAAQEPSELGGARWAPPADLVGIGPDADAFAYLFASKALRPPLAVGLFGNWGSGKSYFQHVLQRRIDEIVARADAGDASSPLHRHVVQVRFNAWQFVEGDVVASMVDHLFRNLGVGAADDDLLAQRRVELVAPLRAAGMRLAEASERRRELMERRDRATTQVVASRRDRDAAAAELDRRRAQQPLENWRPSEELSDTVRSAAEHAGLPSLARASGDLADALTDARRSLSGVGPIAGAVCAGGWRWTAALVFVLLATPMAVVTAGALADLPEIGSAVGALASCLAAVTIYVRAGSQLVRAKLRAIEDARQQLDAADEAKRQQLRQAVELAEERLRSAEAAMDVAVDEERRLQSDEDEIHRKLEQLTPAGVLHDFIAERRESDDYRRRLGIPSLVRRDLQRLSQLVDEQNRRASNRSDTSVDVLPLNRVVLYIDDLDRCPADVVVNVLQAVHLLLSFPLFVVVVAVDIRWLKGALRTELQPLDAASDGPSPVDYLEKIFQIPYWIKPLRPSERSRLAIGLLQGNVGSATPPSVGRSGEATQDVVADVPDDFHQRVDALYENQRQEPTALDFSILTVTVAELHAIDRLAPLLGPTPRAIKRFVNLYLVAKAIGRARGLDAGDRGAGTYVPLLWLLAVGEMHPQVVSMLGRRRGAGPSPGAVASDDESIVDAVRSLVGSASGEPSRDRLVGGAELTDVVRWLELNSDVAGLAVSALLRWEPVVAPLSFRDGTDG